MVASEISVADINYIASITFTNKLKNASNPFNLNTNFNRFFMQVIVRCA